MDQDKKDKKQRAVSVEILEKNLKSAQQFTIETRKLVRQLQDENKGYLNKVITLEEKIDTLQSQIQALQVRIFSGASTQV